MKVTLNLVSLFILSIMMRKSIALFNQKIFCKTLHRNRKYSSSGIEQNVKVPVDSFVEGDYVQLTSGVILNLCMSMEINIEVCI
jgi:hypothetical protein